MRSRYLEHVAIRHRFHLVYGVRRYAIGMPDLQPDIRRRTVRPVRPDAVDDFPGEQKDGFVFHIVVLHGQRLPRVDMQNLTDIRIGAGPDGLVTPRLLYEGDLDWTRHNGRG